MNFADKARDTLLHGPDTMFRQIIDPSVPPGTIYFMPPLETILAAMAAERLTFEAYVEKYKEKFAVITNVGESDAADADAVADEGTRGTPQTETAGEPGDSLHPETPRDDPDWPYNEADSRK